MSGSASAWWRDIDTNVLVRVRVTPNSSRDGVEGVGAVSGGAAILVRLRAAPREGEANAAVTCVMADWLSLPCAAVRLKSGARSRVKLLMIDSEPGLIEERLAQRLAQLQE